MIAHLTVEPSLLRPRLRKIARIVAETGLQRHEENALLHTSRLKGAWSERMDAAMQSDRVLLGASDLLMVGIMYLIMNGFAVLVWFVEKMYL